MKCTTGDLTIRTCSSRPSQSLRQGWGARPARWPLTRPSIRQRTKPAPKPGASSGSASQISTESPERRREQKKRWFRNGQKWRTGCEGRISVVKRRHGLDRCQYKGLRGMRRWVGARRHRRQLGQYRPRLGAVCQHIAVTTSDRSPTCRQRGLLRHLAPGSPRREPLFRAEK